MLWVAWIGSELTFALLFRACRREFSTKKGSDALRIIREVAEEVIFWILLDKSILLDYFRIILSYDACLKGVD